MVGGGMIAIARLRLRPSYVRLLHPGWLGRPARMAQAHRINDYSTDICYTNPVRIAGTNVSWSSLNDRQKKSMSDIDL
jgi:hypothetical protein